MECYKRLSEFTNHIFRNSFINHLQPTYFTKAGFEQKDEESEGTMPILVVYDELREGFWALDADKKGANSEVIKWCCDTLEDSGYLGADVTVKSDQEPAIAAVRKGIAVNRVGNTVPLNSPVRCSKSNGRVENAVKRFQGHLRVLKHRGSCCPNSMKRGIGVDFLFLKKKKAICATNWMKRWLRVA